MIASGMLDLQRESGQGRLKGGHDGHGRTGTPRSGVSSQRMTRILRCLTGGWSVASIGACSGT